MTIRFRIDFSADCAVGPGKIALLEAIARAGSLSRAARELGMSYRRAWLLLDSLNRAFDTPVATLATGGRGGGGAALTGFGAELIATYRTLETQVERCAVKTLRPIADHVMAARATRGVPRRALARPRRAQ